MSNTSDSFRLRPVFVSIADSWTELLAATEHVMLLRNHKGRPQFFVVRGRLPAADESSGIMEKLPAGMIYRSAHLFCFLNDRTMCCIASDRMEAPKLIVIYSDDNLFKVNLVERSYNIGGMGEGRRITSMLASNGQLVLSTLHGFTRNNQMQSFLQSWTLEIPEPSSTCDNIHCHDCGGFGTPSVNIFRVDSVHSNERLIASTFTCCGDPHDPYNYKTVIHDLKTAKTHVISKRRLCDQPAMDRTRREDIVRPISSTVMLHLQTRSTDLSVSVIRVLEDGIERVTHSARMPVAIVDVINGHTGHRRTEVLIVGNRFFFNLNEKCFVGYLPGTDVPLEELSAISIWNDLPRASQYSLITEKLCSNRSLLLRACSEEQNRNILSENSQKIVIDDSGEATEQAAKRSRD